MGILKIYRICPQCGERIALRVAISPCPEIKKHEKIKRIRQD